MFPVCLESHTRVQQQLVPWWDGTWISHLIPGILQEVQEDLQGKKNMD